MQERVFQLLFEQDEVTWQTMIYELVRSEQMDPWDVDVSELAAKYIDMLKKLKEMDFRISGKVVLAAALLLRMKSTRLVTEDMGELDRLMSGNAETDLDDFYEGLRENYGAEMATQLGVSLVARTPQPRKRKVSVYDLVDALRQALDVSERRRVRFTAVPNVKIPERKVDISLLIRDVYQRITSFFANNKSPLSFSQLLTPAATKEEKILTFIPLLHLSNQDQRRIDLQQSEHFGEIYIELLHNAPATVQSSLGPKQNIQAKLTDIPPAQ